MRRFIENMTTWVACLLVLSLLALIGWIDLITGYEFSILPFYFIPVAITAWRLGLWPTFLLSFTSGLIWLGADSMNGHLWKNIHAAYWNAAMRAIFFFVGGSILVRLRNSLHQKENLIRELQQALRQVKTLEGILPICPCCGKIRTRQGSWDRLETYVKEESNVEFMTNTCPDCAKTQPISATLMRPTS